MRAHRCKMIERIRPMPKVCEECDGEKQFEVPVGIIGGRHVDGPIKYVVEGCRRCGGTGIDPVEEEPDDDD
jgi:hypothetical protein